jgi:hypothetical protein
MREQLPKKGQQVMTKLGAATVTGANPLKETAMVELESGATVELSLSEISAEAGPHHKRKKKE